MSAVSAVNAVNWFEIYVQDMARARAFYESVFQVRLEALKLPEGGDDGLEMTGVPSGPGGTLVYFACEDCGATASRIASAGGRVHRGKMSIGEYGFIVLAFDTEGNMIGLHSMQ